MKTFLTFILCLLSVSSFGQGVAVRSLSGQGTNLTLKGSGALKALIVDTNKLVVSTNGNVGIGTNAPGASLHVVGSTLLNGLLTMQGNVNFSGFDATNMGTLDVTTLSAQTFNVDTLVVTNKVGIGTNAPAATEEIFSTNASGAFRINSPHKSAIVSVLTNGFFGIGNAAPTRELQIDDAGADSELGISRGGGASILFRAGSVSAILRSESAHPLILGANGGELMRLTTTSNVGINTNGPVTTFEVFSADTDGAVKVTSPHGTVMSLMTNGIVSFRTNAVAPTPVAGMYSLWSSNYALYLITPNKTNLISDGN